MTTQYQILHDTYHDSVQLMRIASDVAQSPAIETTDAVMGTATNRQTLLEFDGLTEADLSEVQSDDVVLVATSPDPDAAAEAVEEMTSRLESAGDSEKQHDVASEAPKSIRRACKDSTIAVALISVSGTYAAREAWKALHEGLHTHVFSDNVSLEREHDLKTFAHEKGQLLMGPDCGTAILDGVPLGFANEVSTGSIGLVSASGTGLQAVSTHISRHGAGISQAIGTGGRDLSETIKGLTTRTAIEYLDSDETTDVIVLISKPPAEPAVDAVLETISNCETPVIIHFQGVDMYLETVRTADTLEETANLALEVTGNKSESVESDPEVDKNALKTEVRSLSAARTDIRGLFVGGTLCTEAVLMADKTLEDVSSNVGVGKRLLDPLEPSGHAFIDFGTDELTMGRPHPMIDPTVRNEQLREALEQQTTGIVLLDIVLGHGSHQDPAGSIVDTVATTDSNVPIIAAVCGTDDDPQSRSEQIRILRDAGIYVADSNAAAARLAVQGATWMTAERPEEGSA